MAPMEVAHFSYCYGWQRISADSTLARAELCLRADIVAVIGTSPGAFGSGPTTASKDDTNGPLIFSRYCGPLRRGYMSGAANWDSWPPAAVCSLVHRQRVRNSSESDIAANAFQVIP
jgi:hypothetical protein